MSYSHTTPNGTIIVFGEEEHYHHCRLDYLHWIEQSPIHPVGVSFEAFVEGEWYNKERCIVEGIIEPLSNISTIHFPPSIHPIGLLGSIRLEDCEAEASGYTTYDHAINIDSSEVSMYNVTFGHGGIEPIELKPKRKRRRKKKKPDDNINRMDLLDLED